MVSRRSAAVLVAVVSACLGALIVVGVTCFWSKTSPIRPRRTTGTDEPAAVRAESPDARPVPCALASPPRTMVGSPVRIRLQLLPYGIEVPVTTVDGRSPAQFRDGGGEFTANVHAGGPVDVGTSDPRALVRSVRWDVPREPPAQVTLFVADADWARQQPEVVLAVIDADSSQPLPGAFFDAGSRAPAVGRIAADRNGHLRLDPAFVAETVGWRFFVQSIYAPGYRHEDKDFLAVESEQWRAWSEGRPMKVGLRPYSSPRRTITLRVVSSAGDPVRDVLLEAKAFPVSRIPPVRTSDDGTAQLIDLDEDVRYLCVACFVAGVPIARFVIQVPPLRAESEPLKLELPDLADVHLLLEGQLDPGAKLAMVLASTRVEYVNLQASGLGPYEDLLPGITGKQNGRLELERGGSEFRFRAPVGSEISLAFLRSAETGERRAVGKELTMHVAREGNRIVVSVASLR